MSDFLRLMVDYGCFPLWRPGGEGDLDPAELRLPGDLTARLLAWAAAFDSTLNRDDPASPLPMRAAFLRSGEDGWHGFEREGHILWRAVREIRPDLRVAYHSVLLGRSVEPGEDELLDRLDDAGGVTGVLWRSASDGVPHVRGVNAFLRNEAGELFFPRRAGHKARWPGALDFSVGGYVLAGETFDEALEREAREELNLGVETGWRVVAVLGPLDSRVSCCMHVYELPFGGTPDLNPADFSGGAWLRPEAFLKRVEAGERVKGDLVEVVRLVYGG